LALLATALPVAIAPSSAATARLRGIDISHWQGSIDWRRVADDGISFAIAKASQGTGFVDDRYAANRAGARSAGVTFGAYHFADPDPRAGDARAEADHFLEVADPRPGELIPTLDIERNGGLSPAALRTWVRTWLERVRARLGVRPMIYTGPYFWETSMGGTSLFADLGYDVLWVAHWTDGSPTVPGGNWGGHGWTFWQYTDCERVAGIAGCVDGDRFNGTDLSGVTVASIRVSVTGGGTVVSAPGDISCGTRCEGVFHPGTAVTLTAEPAPGQAFTGWTGACTGTDPCTLVAKRTKRVGAVFADETPPSATVRPPTTLTGPVVMELSEPVSGVDAGSVGLRVEGTAGAPSTRLRCTRLDGRSVDCASGPARRVRIVPVAPLIAGQRYEVWMNGSTPTSVVDRSGTPATPLVQGFRAATVLDQSAAEFSWAEVRDERALGGSFLAEDRARASIEAIFAGREVTWIGALGPRMGRAIVRIDGRYRATVDLSATRFAARWTRTFGGLSAGSHRIEIVVTGSPGRRSVGGAATVAVDGFRTPAGPLANRASRSAWATADDPLAAGGTLAASARPGARATFVFRGTEVGLGTVLGPDRGTAQLWVDGALVKTVDLFAPVPAVGIRWARGLPDGVHRVRVVVTGRHTAGSSAAAVAIDGWTVG
jgi:GH25 family lysozyme M1 (1,4-beta-N-acetylmuramidase)